MNAPIQLPGLPDGIDHEVVVEQMIRRARSGGFNAWWQRVEGWGSAPTRSTWLAVMSSAAITRYSRDATTGAPPCARRARICTYVTRGSSSTQVCAADTTMSPPP
jgi:hypothetical protein